MRVTGHSLVAGVIGWPIAHTRSPLIHNYWLNRHFIDGVYIPLAVRPSDLAIALDGLRVSGVRGVNVTLPHKEAAFTLADHHDASALETGAVNTLVFQPDGSMEGRNTDPEGFICNLRQHCPDLDFSMESAVVLGAGGAARAVTWGLLQAGVSSIAVVNRSFERAERLGEDLGPAIVPTAWHDLDETLEDCTLLINATSLGMTGQPPLDLDLDALPEKAIVTDLVYAPLQTTLLRTAAARGNTVVDGLGMLLHQAVPGFAAWFGVRPEVDEALRQAVMDG
jgi:shikimate dehydrogenase